MATPIKPARVKTITGARDHPVIHFEIAADNPAKLSEFYGKAFGWKTQSMPGQNYQALHTKSSPDGPGIEGGLVQRVAPGQRGLNYILVEDVALYVNKVRELGGTVMIDKIVVPGQGYVALCADPDGNAFGLWQDDANAKPEPAKPAGGWRREAA